MIKLYPILPAHQKPMSASKTGRFYASTIRSRVNKVNWLQLSNKDNILVKI